MRNFKELLIWQKGHVSQINRASSSIPANIAEEASRKGIKDQARFIQIALGSTFELETFFIGISRLNLVENAELESILNLIIEEQKMLSGYLKKLVA